MRSHKLPESVEQGGEAVADSGLDGVESVVLLASEVVAAHPMPGLYAANDRLDGGATAHLALDGWDDAAFLAAGDEPELVALQCVVAR